MEQSIIGKIEQLTYFNSPNPDNQKSPGFEASNVNANHNRERASEFEKRINGKLRTLGALIGAVCCFLVDEDLATGAELEALATNILNSTGEDDLDLQKFFEDLQDGEADERFGYSEESAGVDDFAQSRGVFRETSRQRDSSD